MKCATNVSRLVVLGVAGMLGGCQTAVTVPQYDGAMVYQGYCASCHGPIGQGDGPVARSLNVPLADLRTISARSAGAFPREMLETVIDGRGQRAAHGTRDMPVWGWNFSRAESAMGEPEPEEMAAARIRALVDYIESIQIDEG